MKKIHIKLILLTLMVVIAIVFLPNNGTKADTSNMPKSLDVGDEFYIGLDLEDESLLSLNNFGNSTKWIYCIDKGANILYDTSEGGLYTVLYQVKIDGLNATCKDVGNPDWVYPVKKETITSKHNAILAYILNKGDEHGYKEKDGVVTDTQKAIWNYFPVWMKNIGINGFGISRDFLHDNNQESTDLTNAATRYANELSSQEVSTAISSIVTDNYLAGPFKINYNDSIKSITVFFSDNSKIEVNAGIENNSNIKFYSDKEHNNEIKDIKNIASDSNFYIVNPTNKELSKVNVKVNQIKTTYKATISILRNLGSQDMIAVDTDSSTSESEDTVEFDITPEKANLNLRKLSEYKVYDESQEKFVYDEETISGVQFKVYNQTLKKWVQGNGGNVKYVDSFNNATIYETDSNGKVSINGLLAGESYLYTIVEISAKNKGYYNDPIKIEGATVSYGTTVYYKSPVIKESNGISYYAVEDISLLYDISADIGLDIKDERTSGDLIIIKEDSKNNDLKLAGAEFKILLEEAENTGDTNKWLLNKNTSYDYTNILHNDYLTSNKNSAGKFVTDANGRIEIKGIINGTYHVYETKAPNGYDLEKQEGYDPTNKWVDCGTKKISSNSSKIVYELKNTKDASIKLKKLDSETGQTLDGAEFFVKAEIDNTKYYLNVTKDSNNELVTSYRSSGNITSVSNIPENGKIKTVNGEVTIDLSKDGTYTIYEIKAPNGYDISKQKGYEANGKWVNCGTVNLKDGKLTSNNMNFNQNGATFDIEIENEKLIDIKGYVWVDRPDTKYNVYDNIYRNGTDSSGNKFNDVLYKDGITVNLYKNGQKIETTKTFTESDKANDSTKEIGHYEFIKKVKRSDLKNCYVEFEYDKQKYICIQPFVGTDSSKNSKAQEYKMEVKELEDENLNGTIGKAVTNQTTNNSTTGLEAYYNTDNRTVENINLGLLEKKDPEYAISEELEYMRVEINGWDFTYIYGEDAALPIDPYNPTPTANMQNSKKTYTGTIYATDIAFNALNGGNKLNVYVVYSINITNTQNVFIDDIYNERKLYLSSLQNNYDKDRYKVCTDERQNPKNDTEIDNQNKQFKLWSGDSGEAIYNLNHDDSKYKDGIEPGGEGITTYIQFKITDQALANMLTGDIPEAESEKAPTQAISNGYHEYLRTDYLWNHESKIKAFEGCNEKEEDYPVQNSASKKYYVHKSTSKTCKSGSLYFIIRIGEARTISGTVFKDNNEKTNGEIIGNGVWGDSENKIENVTVELIETDQNGNIEQEDNLPKTANLYQYKDGKIMGTDKNEYEFDENGIVNIENAKPKKASTTTNKYGTYKFEGVMPGYYIIRYTYGDGTQILCDTDGNAIKVKDEEGNKTTEDVKITSSDYKSTIINNDIMSTINDENKGGYWYRKIGDNYSLATDDLDEQKNLPESYVYKDGTEYGIYSNGDEKEREEIAKKSVHANTPYFGVLIENIDGNSINVAEGMKKDILNNGFQEAVNNIVGYLHNHKYNKFNFGIIERPKITIITEKKITNISLTNQVGATLVSQNPADRNGHYITALDEVDGGSRYARMEIETNQLYGSDLIATYELTLKNDSDLDYVEKDEEDEGYYYKFGIIIPGKTVEKEVSVQELQDTIANFNSKTNTETKIETKTVKNEDGSTTETKEKEVTLVPARTVTTTNEQGITITGWSDMKKGESVSITYDATAYLSTDNSMEFGNEAQITKIKLDKLTTLTSSSEWHRKIPTQFIITPPTGQNKSYEIYIISGTILIVMAVGILLIKKFVL